jgi:hypothetical protein
MDKLRRGVKAEYTDFVKINSRQSHYNIFIRPHSNLVSRSKEIKGLAING